jgi:type I restriction enzyme S subunit
MGNIAMKQLKKVRLKDLCLTKISNGAFNDPQKVGTGYRLINVKDLYNEPTIDENNLGLLELDEKEFRRYSVETGDLFFTRSSLKAEGIAQCNIYTGNSDDIVYECHIMRVRADLDIVCPLFLYHFCKSFQARKYFIRHSKVATMTTIDQSDLGKLPILLPPLFEQKAIADLLSTWDVAIEKIERLIEAKEKQKQSELRSLISNQKANSTIGCFAKPVIRKVDKPDKSYLALGIRSHFKGTFQRLVEDPSTVNMNSLFKVKENDLIVNITFAWEGAIALVNQEDEKCYVSHRFPTYKIKKSKAEPCFIRQMIRSSRMKYDLSNISPGGAGRNRVLNKKDFLKMPIWLPDINTQKDIGEYLGAIDKEINLLKQLAEKYKTQKRGLMQKMLTGEWRVKPEIIKTYE